VRRIHRGPPLRTHAKNGPKLPVPVDARTQMDCCSVFQTPFAILSGPETKGLARRTLTTPKGFGIS
jgi:hypothetical protein